MSEDQHTQLKSLISKGKDQGFLTYAEVNDHLPDDIVDPEQIEDIINMINDMGIEVHEHAPDTEDLLLSDNAVTTEDEDEAEEAVAVLASTVDAELGRTTDPVRMYMREMGTVELLTREGEIRIAKRIEEGQTEVLHALASYPGSVAYLIQEYRRVVDEGTRLADVIVGFVDPEPEAEPAEGEDFEGMAEEFVEEGATEEDEENGEEAEEAVDTGPDPEEAARRMAEIEQQFERVLQALREHGYDHPDTQARRQELFTSFMRIRLSPRMIHEMSERLRETTDRVRALEKQIMDICVNSAGMSRRDFLQCFQDHETDAGWVDKQIRPSASIRRSSAVIVMTSCRSSSSSWRWRRRPCCRSWRSRKPIAARPSVRPRPGAPRRRWSRPTCAW